MEFTIIDDKHIKERTERVSTLSRRAQNVLDRANNLSKRKMAQTIVVEDNELDNRNTMAPIVETVEPAPIIMSEQDIQDENMNLNDLDLDSMLNGIDFGSENLNL